MRPDNRCYTPLADGTECCLHFTHAGDHKPPGLDCHDIADPDRWPLTWATSLELHYLSVHGNAYLDRREHAEVYDALESVRIARVDAAERLECSVEVFGYQATPVSPEDCCWYRKRAGHEMGDLGYGRYSRAEYLRDSDEQRG